LWIKEIEDEKKGEMQKFKYLLFLVRKKDEERK